MTLDTLLGIQVDGSEKKQPKPKHSIAIPLDILMRLKSLKLIDNEPPASIINRLLDEHQARDMQKVVRKLVK